MSVTLPVSFRYPSGILPACRRNDCFAIQRTWNQARSCTHNASGGIRLDPPYQPPCAPNHQNSMESFRYPSGGPSVRACPSLLVWGRAGRPLQTQLSDQLGSAKSAPALQIIKIRWNPSGILPAGRVSRPASVYWFEEERGASSKHTFPISSDPLNQPPRLKSSKFDGILPVSFRRADAPGLPRFPGLGGGGRGRGQTGPHFRTRSG